MTVAFENFMKQYKMTGSEKADGYSRDAFEGLEEHEKDAVFKLLVQELPYSAEWLFFVDAEKAVVVAKEEEQKLRGNGYASAYMLQEQLLKHTDDLLYQDHMIEDYPSYVDNLKPLVVDSIGRTPANPTTVAFLKQVVLTEVNMSAVSRAARKLAAIVNVPRATEADEEKYSRLIKELRSENVDVKLKAIKQIAKFETSSS
jgi:hypothetical protein